jgi:hypothetical protein
MPIGPKAYFWDYAQGRTRSALCAIRSVWAHRAQRSAVVDSSCHSRKLQVGSIRLRYTQFGVKGHVVAQRSAFGAILPKGSRVNLVVSRGRKGSRAGRRAECLGRFPRPGPPQPKPQARRRLVARSAMARSVRAASP